MKRFIKRISFVLFWQALALLTVLYVSEIWYAVWSASFVLLFFVLLFISGKVVPSKKEETILASILDEYKTIEKLEDEMHADSLQIDLKCPSCNVQNNLWSFIEDYKCRKCGSDLWTSKVGTLGEKFEKALAKRNKIHAFYSKLNLKYRRKVKKFRMTGLA